MSKTAVHLKINATVMARDYCSGGFHFTLTTPNFRYSAHLFLCFREREREITYIYISSSQSRNRLGLAVGH